MDGRGFAFYIYVERARVSTVAIFLLHIGYSKPFGHYRGYFVIFFGPKPKQIKISEISINISVLTYLSMYL